MAQTFEQLRSLLAPREPTTEDVINAARGIGSGNPTIKQMEDAIKRNPDRRSEGGPIRLAGPMPQNDTPQGLPPGASYVDEAPRGLPPGASYVDSKAERFLKNVTPEGPISGVIALGRTALEASRGQRPDLLTNPENAVPEAVWGSVAAGTGARVRPLTAEQAAIAPTPKGPLQLTSRLSPEEAARIDYQQRKAAAGAEAERVSQGLRARGEMPAESGGPSIEIAPALGQAPARDAALAQAARPHVNKIMSIGQRSPEVMKVLEGIVPEETLIQALADPGKAASLSHWLQIAEKATRAKFTPMARSSLELATRNLEHNLGITIGPKGE